MESQPYSPPEIVEKQQLLQQILIKTAGHFGISVDSLCGKSRTQPLAEARQVAMYILRSTGLTLQEVGRVLGGRDHSTVSYGVRKIERLSNTYPEFGERVRTLANEVLFSRLNINHVPSESKVFSGEQSKTLGSQFFSELTFTFFDSLPLLSKREFYAVSLYRTNLERLPKPVRIRPTLDAIRLFVQDQDIQGLKKKVLKAISPSHRDKIYKNLVFVDCLYLLGRVFSQTDEY